MISCPTAAERCESSKATDNLQPLTDVATGGEDNDDDEEEEDYDDDDTND